VIYIELTVIPTPDEALLLSGFFVSVFAPLLISWLKSDKWPKVARLFFAVITSTILGALTAYGNGETGASFYMTIIAIITATNVFWRLFVRDTGLEELLNPDE
jgi:uncharacterized membrane protein YfcA